MKFSEYKYERPDLEQVQKHYADYIDELKEAQDADKFMVVFNKLNQMRNHITSMKTIASLRYTINTADEFYEKENDYWDEYSPFYQQLDTRLYKTIMESDLLDELKKRIPSTFFGIISCQLKAFDDAIMEDLQQENRIATQYDKLKASAKIEFEGKTYNLPGISALCESKDRELRKKASEAKLQFIEQTIMGLSEMVGSFFMPEIERSEKNYNNIIS